MDISPQASEVNGFAKEEGELCQHGKLVETVPLADALRDFIHFMKKFHRPVLVAHNAFGFDARFLLIALQCHDMLEDFKDCVSGFFDTLQFANAKHPYMRRNLKALVETFLHDVPYQAHDALEDSRVLYNLFLDDQFGAKVEADRGKYFQTVQQIENEISL